MGKKHINPNNIATVFHIMYGINNDFTLLCSFLKYVSFVNEIPTKNTYPEMK